MTKLLLAAILAMNTPITAELANTLAYNIADAAESQRVDPWLMVALAYHESGFDQTVISRNGSFGYFQIHPRYWGAPVIRLCGMHPEHCVWWQSRASAQALRHYQRLCHGIGRAVAAYRHGYCVKPRPRDLAVVALRNRLAREWGWKS